IANGGMYAGATTNKMLITAAPASMNSYKYRCVVSGVCAPGLVISGDATLTVNSNVVINTQPLATTICSGGNTSLSVAATGTGISYQWYTYNGTTFVPVTNTGVHSGATSATLNITGLASATPAVY